MSIHFDKSGDIVRVESENFHTDSVGFDAVFVDGTEVEYPVSNVLFNYSHRPWGSPIPSHWDNVNDAVEEAYESGYTGLGVVTEPNGQPLDAGVSTDQYGSGYYANGHLCELVTGESNARSIKHMFEENQARFFEHAGLFFYDTGHTVTVDLVVSIERGLSDYPLVDEMDHSMLEEVIREKMFADELPTVSVDKSVDTEEIWVAWADQDGNSYCPECGTGDSVERILEDSHYRECDECGDWFDPTHGFASDDECVACVKDARQTDIKVKQRYGFYPDTGEGLMIRFDGHTYVCQDGQWKQTTVHVDDHVYGR